MAAKVYSVNAIQTLMSTEMNSLDLNTLLLGSTAIDNVAGGTSGYVGYPLAQFELTLAAPSVSFQGIPIFECWLIPAMDGTNYENNATRPLRVPDVQFYVYPSASAQRIIGVNAIPNRRDDWAIQIPPGLWKPLVRVLHDAPRGPSTLAASGNILKVKTFSFDG